MNARPLGGPLWQWGDLSRLLVSLNATPCLVKLLLMQFRPFGDQRHLPPWYPALEHIEFVDADGGVGALVEGVEVRRAVVVVGTFG